MSQIRPFTYESVNTSRPEKKNSLVIFHSVTSNISWLQLLKSEDLLIFLLIILIFNTLKVWTVSGTHCECVVVNSIFPDFYFTN